MLLRFSLTHLQLPFIFDKIFLIWLLCPNFLLFYTFWSEEKDCKNRVISFNVYNSGEKAVGNTLPLDTPVFTAFA
jgi:hypothetical protein